MAEAKSIKVIFGETYPGNIRVMIGSDEIPNVRSVRLLEVKPGELPEIDIKILAPKLEIENKTEGDVAEMEEVELPLSPAEKAIANGKPGTAKSSVASTVKKGK